MIEVDLARSEVVLGTVRVLLQPAGSAFRLPGGATVRLSTFGERSWSAREALAGADLVETLRSFAMQGEPDALGDAVMLALAGGGEEAPSFEICAVEAARIHGWSWKALNEAPAIEVDRAVAVSQEDGWKRFVFGTEEIDELVKEMVERLLERAVGGSEQRAPSERSEQRRHAAWPNQVTPEYDAIRLRVPDSQAGEFDTDAAVVHVGQAFSLRTRSQRVQPSAARPVAKSKQAATDVRVASHVATPPLTNEAAATPVGQALSLRTRSQRVQPSAARPAPVQPELKLTPASTWIAVSHTDGRSSGEWRSERPPQPEGPPDTSETTYLRPVAHAQHRQSSAAVTPACKLEFATPATDWLEEIARRLAAECDLRGLDA
jgi:hypothetical protein